MSRFTKIFLSAVAALVLYESIACAIDPDFMWFEKRAVSADYESVEEIAETETEPAEIVEFEVVAVCGSSEAETEPETETELETETGSTSNEIRTYTVNGARLCDDLQVYIYHKMEDFGVDPETYIRFWLAEIYQESRYDVNADNGRDVGLCQLRRDYHDYFKECVGYPDFDLVNDYYANLSVGTWLFCENLRATNYDLDAAIMLYYNSGDPAADAKYLQDVKQWFDTIE